MFKTVQPSSLPPFDSVYGDRNGADHLEAVVNFDLQRTAHTVSPGLIRDTLREEIKGKEEDVFPHIWTYGPPLYDQTTSYQPSYFELDQERFGLQDDQPETHRFYRCFTAPAATRVAFQHLRPFIATVKTLVIQCHATA